MTAKTIWSVLLILFSSWTATGAPVAQELPGATPAMSAKYELLLTLARNGDTGFAVETATQLVELFDSQYGEESHLLAMPVIYLALSQIEHNDSSAAIQSFTRAISIIETHNGMSSMLLVPPLQGIALAHMELRSYESATESLYRAQNITRRNKGVYNEEQIPVIDKLMEVSRRSRAHVTRYRLHQLYLQVHKNSFGTDDERTVPALTRVGSYQSEILSRMRYRPDHKKLFSQAIGHLEHAIEIIESAHGANDLRLVEPLRALANARFINALGKDDAAAALRRVVDIARSNPGSDAGDVALATVQLGDLLNLWNDNRSDEVYLEAWKSIPDDQQYEDLRQTLFGEPVRLLPTSLAVYLGRRPDIAGDDEKVYSELEYVVRADGRARKIKVVGGNVPNHRNKSLRNKLFRSRYRPRIVDGELVATEDMSLVQDFGIYR
jgi:tetratricopeptide (TPR) repeat protein